MKLGEAILVRDSLKERLKILQSRILQDQSKTTDLSRLQEEHQTVENKIRDLSIAITWTEHQTALSELPLIAYRIRIGLLEESAKFWEQVNREKADALLESAQNDRKVLAAATWLVDLQIPKVDVPKNKAKPKEEE